MRLDRIHIDSFGRYTAADLGPFDHPLTVICGPNEAGKTTLLAFIRHVLFGFPTGNTSANKYMTNGRGAHGGRLHILADDGHSYGIERKSGGPAAGTMTLSTGDGTLLDPAQLPQLIGHANQQLFESIFAFDLDALTKFDAPDNAEISSRLYGAGAGVSRLAEVLKSLRTERDAIFLSGGRNRPVNELLSQLDVVNDGLRAVEDQADQFSRLTQEVHSASEEIDKLNGDVRDVAERRADFDRQANAWEPWVKLKGVREQLLEVPTFDTFPEEAVARLERIEERLREAAEAVRAADLKAEQARDAAGRTLLDRELLEHAETIVAIREQRSAFSGSVRDLPARQVEAATEASRLQEELATLGQDWTPQRVDTVDISIPRRDEARRSGRDLDAATQGVREAERARDDRRRDLGEARARVSELERAPGATPIQLVAPISLATRIAGFGVLLLMGIIAAVVGRAFGSDMITGLGIGASAAGLIAVAYLLSERAGTGQSAVRVVGPDTAQAAAEAARNVEQLQVRLDEAGSALQREVDRREELARGWSGWLREHGLPENLTADGAGEVLARGGGARAPAATLGERRNRAEKVERDIAAYRELVLPVAQVAGINVDETSESVARAADAVGARYDQARSLQQHLQNAVESALERERELAEHQRRLAGIEEECRALLRAGDAPDAETFRRMASEHTLRRSLEEAERDLIETLRLLLGVDADLEALDRALRVTTREAVETERAALEEQRHDLLEQRDGVLQRRAERQATLDRLEGDDEASRLGAQRVTLLEQLQQRAEEWSRYAIARALLEHARRRYEQERQPVVIEHASRFFSDLTGGRYLRLYRSVDDERMFRVIEAGTEIQRTPQELSRGTREQLYLALRLAAVLEFGQRQERLPVIVDEILVNFDPERARHAAIAFGNLAQHNQVIVFTCHPWVRDIFSQAVPGTAVINL